MLVTRYTGLLCFKHKSHAEATKLRDAGVPQLFFLDPKGGSQKATIVVLVVVISSLKIPKVFLIRSSAQQNFSASRSVYVLAFN